MIQYDMAEDKTHIAEFGEHDPNTGKDPDTDATSCFQSGRQVRFNLDEVKVVDAREYLRCECGHFVLIRDRRRINH